MDRDISCRCGMTIFDVTGYVHEGQVHCPGCTCVHPMPGKSEQCKASTSNLAGSLPGAKEPGVSE